MHGWMRKAYKTFAENVNEIFDFVVLGTVARIMKK
jgi:hypothetical protein